MADGKGNVRDVAPTAAHALASTGWHQIADGVGTTAQRPTTGLKRGFRYLDTTLNKLVVWYGAGGGISHPTAQEPGFWLDATSGASV
jgi:hypothetical protein